MYLPEELLGNGIDDVNDEFDTQFEELRNEVHK